MNTIELGELETDESILLNILNRLDKNDNWDPTREK